MAQDITAIIDGIKASVERVGKSSREEIYLDNITFRVEALEAVSPRGCNVSEAEEDADWFFASSAVDDYDLNIGHFIVNASGDDSPDSDIVSIQYLPMEWTADGPRVNMTVNMWACDVANNLAQTVSMSAILLKSFADAVQAEAGKITFNIAYAYVPWEDVDQLVEWDDIEIPR